MNKKEAVAGVIARHGEEILDNASNPGKLVKAIGKAGKDLDRTLHPQGIPVSMGGAVFYCGDGCKITNDMWKVLEDIILWWYDDTTPPSNIGEDRQSDRKVMLRRMEQYGDELDWLFDTYLAGGLFTVHRSG